jgi:hypothetical protein
MSVNSHTLFSTSIKFDDQISNTLIRYTTKFPILISKT